MALDIITIALIVIPMGLGMTRGFLYIFMRFVGWIGGMVAAFFGTPVLRDYLAQGFVGERIRSMLEEQFAPVTDQLPGGGDDAGDTGSLLGLLGGGDAGTTGGATGAVSSGDAGMADSAASSTSGGDVGDNGSLPGLRGGSDTGMADSAASPTSGGDVGGFGDVLGFATGDPAGTTGGADLLGNTGGLSAMSGSSSGDGYGLPAILGNVIGEAVNDTVDAVINTLEGLILTVVSFLLIVIAVRLLLIFVIRPLTRRRGKVSLPNKVAGLALGMLEGLLLAFLFLAALVPVQNMVSPETAAAISQNLTFSYLAGPLYDGNLLLAILGQVLGT